MRIFFNKKRLLQVVLFAILIIFMISGCSSSISNKKNIQTNQESKNGIYPFKTDVTLKYWMILHNNVSEVTNNFGNLPIAKELEKKTGIKVKYIHPPKGQEHEAFTIMIASGDMPDIIEITGLRYPGGPNNAISSGIILKLDELMKKDAPNLSKYLSGYPEIDKMIKTDNGHYYVFPFLRPDEELLVTFGPVLRKDWLDELGLEIPQTLDDWYKMLKAFKEVKNIEAPLTATVKLDDKNTIFSEFIKLFSGATGSYHDFYIEDGMVKFGPIEQNRKFFFQTMAKWYKEGLIDRNIAINDNKAQDYKMLNGKSGATICSGGSGLGKWLIELKNKDPKSNLVAVRYPSLKRGMTPKFGVMSLEYSGTGSAAISAKSKNPDIAAKFLDFMYGEDGHNIMNFGIENISYSKVCNEPRYTDIIMNNPTKIAPVTIMSKYIRAHTNGAFIQDKRYLEQYYSLPEQKKALYVWKNTDQKKYRMLPVTPDTEESVELSNLIKDINDYVDDMTYKFIIGNEPISSFDEYVSQVKKLGIDRVLEIYQSALDRYNKR